MLTKRMIVGGILAVLAGASAAVAQDGQNLRSDLLKRSGPAEAAVRYVTEDGAVAFVLDRSGATPLLRFDGAYEVYALSTVAGPSGSTIFKTDVGEEFVRVSAYGGVTYYPVDRKGGVPAVTDGGSPKIAPAIGGQVALVDALAYLELRLGETLGGGIDIVGPPAVAGHEDFLADAVRVTADALAAHADLARGMTRVAFIEADAAEASYAGGALTIAIAVEHGYAGRPSSDRIAAVLGG